MSTHNIRFYGELTKNILQLSSNTLLICSTELREELEAESSEQGLSLAFVSVWVKLKGNIPT